jgi:hypothetical protein
VFLLLLLYQSNIKLGYFKAQNKINYFGIMPYATNK